MDLRMKSTIHRHGVEQVSNVRLLRFLQSIIKQQALVDTTIDEESDVCICMQRFEFFKAMLFKEGRVECVG